MTLNLNFSSELVLNLGFLELRLKQHFQRHDELGPLLTGQVDVAKFAFTERPANFEVTQFPSVFFVTLR